MVGMIERVHLGWRIPEDVWDAFQSYVVEKHGATAEYVRFELESAMREYLDEDDLLAEAEALLREYTDLQGLSSSSGVASVGTDRYHGETTLVQHRVNSELKERFQMFADEHDQAYGRLLAAALDSYVDGGRERRILDDVERLLTGDASSVEAPAGRDESTGEASAASGSTTDCDESPLSSDTGSASSVEAGASDGVAVEARLVLGVLEELPDADTLADTPLPADEVDKAIARVVDLAGDAELAAYREAVCDQLDLSPHPHKDALLVTDAYRDGHRLYADMDREEATFALRRFVALDAADNSVLKDGFEYTDVQALFEENAGGGAPSHDHAYTLMELAGEQDGFEYGEYRGTHQLRVDLSEVPEAVLEWVCDEAEGYEADLDSLGVNGRLEDYTTGRPPETEGVGDD